jgi:hypothetical protein
MLREGAFWRQDEFQTEFHGSRLNLALCESLRLGPVAQSNIEERLLERNLIATEYALRQQSPAG